MSETYFKLSAFHSDAPTCYVQGVSTRDVSIIPGNFNGRKLYNPWQEWAECVDNQNVHEYHHSITIAETG